MIGSRSRARTVQPLLSLCALAAALLLTGCVTTAPPPGPEVTADGLERRSIRGVDQVYVRPDIDLGRYDRILLDPVEVAFDPAWEPKRTASRAELPAQDREEIRRDTAELFRKAFREELERDGGYPIVMEPGDDVMRVSASLIDLYINAPDTMEPGRSRVYVMDAGRVTLVAELRDSESGALLARVSDKRYGRDVGDLKWSNSVFNAAEAERIFSDWARLLRERLDAVHRAAD